MKRFLCRFLMVFFPFFVLLGYLEIKLSRMDTHYLSKRVAIEKQLDAIEILVLGSSNAYFDFNPAYFSHVGYNMALNLQSPFYDYKLFEKYVDRMPKLKVVVLPAIYIQMGTELPKGSQNWRMYFYRQYFHIPLESNGDRASYFSDILEPKTFSKVALYGGSAYHYYLHNFKDRVDYDPEENGWYNSQTFEHAKLENRNGEISAEAHNKSVDIELFAKNLEYWQRIANIAQAKNIKIVVARLPAHETYFTHLDPVKESKFVDAITQFAERNHARFVDYTRDKRFELDDYTYMTDHMNPQGAAKFSSAFDREVLQSMF